MMTYEHNDRVTVWPDCRCPEPGTVVRQTKGGKRQPPKVVVYLDRFIVHGNIAADPLSVTLDQVVPWEECPVGVTSLPFIGKYGR